MEDSGLISPNLVTFIATIINIGVLCFLLRLILFKPVSKFIEARTKKIEDTINQTEKEKAQAKQLLEQYNAFLKEAETEANEIIRQARETANTEAGRIIANGKNAAETMILNARRQIDAEHEASLAKFKTEAVMLVIAASSRLLGRELHTDDNRHYAGMLMDELTLQYSGASRTVQKGIK